MNDPITFRIVNGHFTDVTATGLVARPDSATASVRVAVAAALSGISADLPTGAIAARIRAAIPFGVELSGTSPLELAEAIGRSGNVAANPTRIGAFTSTEIERLTAQWQDFDWKLIPERPITAAMNLALDEALCEQVAQGRRPPTLRFWGWTESAVVVGRSQVVADETDPTAKHTIVRRITGGGAMFIRPGDVITYSLYLPESAVNGLSIRQSYEVCDAWTVAALRAIGVEAYYIPINDIGWAEGKIAGAAQARRNGVVLHHTTMAYAINPDEMARVLKIGNDKRTGRGVSSSAKVVSPLIRQTTLSREMIVATMVDTFRQRYGGNPDEPTAAEWSTAESLAATKYSTEAWTREFG